jgi:hypothetical protein
MVMKAVLVQTESLIIFHLNKHYKQISVFPVQWHQWTFERFGDKVVILFSRYYKGNNLEWLTESIKILNQDSLHHGHDSNRAAPKYKSE